MLDTATTVATWVGFAYMAAVIIRAFVMAFELKPLYELLFSDLADRELALRLTLQVYYLPAVLGAPSVFLLDPLGAFKPYSKEELQQEAVLIVYELEQVQREQE